VIPDIQLTREQVEEVCSMDGVSLNHEWDGVSEDVPVLIPSRYNPWTSSAGTVKLSVFKEFYVKNILNKDFVHPDG
jgi:hypothetical protein